MCFEKVLGPQDLPIWGVLSTRSRREDLRAHGSALKKTYFFDQFRAAESRPCTACQCRRHAWGMSKTSLFTESKNKKNTKEKFQKKSNEYFPFFKLQYLNQPQNSTTTSLSSPPNRKPFFFLDEEAFAADRQHCARLCPPEDRFRSFPQLVFDLQGFSFTKTHKKKKQSFGGMLDRL